MISGLNRYFWPQFIDLESIQLLYPQTGTFYELLDCGDFEKLERFGDYITIRPEPQAVWSKAWSDAEWQKQAHVRFKGTSSHSGIWDKFRKMPDNWEAVYQSSYLKLHFSLALTSFKHVGVFPEQAVNWEFIAESLQGFAPGEAKVLNLFAYTGGASLAAKAAGADVTHVDSIKQVVSWSRRNMEMSKLDNIRWVVEDAVKFVKREIKRGKKYNGIILDPPAFGHGPNGESWKLEKNINEMIGDVFQLLDPEKNFLILNTYSLGFSAVIIKNLIESNADKFQLKITNPEFAEIVLPARSGVLLPLGVMCRFKNGL